MIEAFVWGGIAASSLLLGGLLVMWRPIPQRALGLVMAFGAGVLISAVAFELAAEAIQRVGSDTWGRVAVGAGLGLGALTYFAGDWWIDRLGGADRKRSHQEAGGSALPLTLGIVLDGIPESVTIGLSLLAGEGVSAAMLVAVFISNVPESMAATTGFERSGRSRRWTLGLWALIVAVSALSSLAGYGLFDTASDAVVAGMLSFAAGAVLTMLADTMMPEAFTYGGKAVGLLTTMGFGVALAIVVLENAG